MKIDKLPFKIGMQYENWEFDLEPVQSKVHLDKYLYIKKDIDILFGLKVQDIFLYFDLEILFKVKILFKVEKPVGQLIELEKMAKGKMINNQKEILSVGNNIKRNELFFTLTDKKYT